MALLAPLHCARHGGMALWKPRGGNAGGGGVMPDAARQKNLEQTGDELIEVMLRTCNGRLTAAEALGHREFVMTRLYESA